MRILHTSDWHLGKTLEGYTRIPEQQQFLADLIQITEDKKIDLVIIAGDIYDNSNPPAQAENLFYESIKKLSNGGKRAILIIAGNHDNPDRLVAAEPLAYEHGILLLGKPKSTLQTGKYGEFEIIDAGEGYFEIEIRGERAIILTLPYPSEQRLQELISKEVEEKERRKSYSERIGEILGQLSKKYRENTVNLLVSHLFMLGGEETGSERPIQLGGALTVDADHLPENAHYIALGHLHKPQKVVGSKERMAYYSGSPLQYNKKEIHYSKCVYVIEANVGQEVNMEEVLLRNYKPIEVWRCSSIENALERCRQDGEREVWVYLEIETDRVLLQSEIKELKSLRRDIVEIKPILEEQDIEEEEYEDITEKSMEDLFSDYYQYRNNVAPTQELMQLFTKILQEAGEEDETQAVEY